MEENNIPEQTDQNGEPMTYWGKSSIKLEPTIRLSEAFEFAHYCSNKQWKFIYGKWVHFLSDEIKTDQELLEIFRSGKENLND